MAGRNYVGYEIKQQYVELAEKRIAAMMENGNLKTRGGSGKKQKTE
jgi:DNA modification methylase